jgi:exosortase/archaeosortase family protein
MSITMLSNVFKSDYPHTLSRFRVELRLLGWIGAGTLLSAVTAPNLPNLVNQSIGDDFGSLFVAIPTVALLVLIFSLRWKELVGVLSAAEGRSQLPVRLVGASIIGTLLALEPITGQSLAGSGIAVVLTFYGTSLVVSPAAKRFMLPYAMVYAAAVGAPALLLWAFGEPLAALSSTLSARLVGLAGFHVMWQGTQFEFLSRTGGVVSGVVTPGCSSVTSVTMFLGLLALMHLDMKKDILSTFKLAALGVLALTFLNSVRILILLWVGYEYGSDALWGVHDWLGYALFLGFFLAALSVYSGMNGPTGRHTSSVGSPSTRI